MDLVNLAQAYLQARRAQELDHTDPALDWLRSEAHDALMVGLDAAGIAYQDREHAAGIALALGEVRDLALVWLDINRAWWRSMVHGPFNEAKGAEHWRLADEAAAAWASYTGALDAAGLVVGDRRGFARELVSDVQVLL